jgi:hypothetical protein
VYKVCFSSGVSEPGRELFWGSMVLDLGERAVGLARRGKHALSVNWQKESQVNVIGMMIG